MTDLLSPPELVEEVSSLSSEDVAWVRRNAQNDLYFLALGVLGYKDVNPATHGAFCRFFQGELRRRRLGLMPRTHLKSTLATIADSLRLGLLNPDDTRVLIAGETATTAELFLKEIKGHFEKNKVLQALFPELVPERFSGPGVTWSANQASLVRSSPHREPTWTALGVGGAVVGSHFTRIKCDDLIGFEALRSPAKMAEARSWVDYIEPLLVDQHEDIIDFIGTRWSKNDLYAHVMKSYGAAMAVFTRSAIEHGEVIFPAKHSMEEYARIQAINPALWYAQYENNPLASGRQDLPIELVKSFTFSLDGTEVILEGGKRWKIEDLDRVITVDPNSGSPDAPDCAATSVQGLSPEDDVIVLNSWSDRPSASGLVDKTFSLVKRWNPRVVGFEKAGQQNTEHYFKLKAEKEGVYVRVEQLNPRVKRDLFSQDTSGKAARIRGSIEPIIKSGKLYILASDVTLRGQIADFPDSPLIDELDALAYGPDLWRRPMSREDIQRKDGVLKMFMRRRSLRTGY